MDVLWFTGETKNEFILYIGGVFLLLCVAALVVGYTQRRSEPNVVAVTNQEEQDQVHEYILVVKTSLLPYSGCSSTTRVFVQLQGQFHNSPFFQLKKNSVTKEILKRGSVDIFVFHTPDDLGCIDSVVLELVDDISEKSVWRPSSLEVYAPDLQTKRVSQRISKLICQQELETHVLLSSKEGIQKNRQWIVQYGFDIVTQHQWLSLTHGATRFGSFTALINLQLFFCVLALILGGSLICLLITRDVNPEFDITHEKVLGCVLTTLVIVILSWSLEAMLRNINPCSKQKKICFNGLHNLRKRNIALEESVKADPVEETGEEKLSREYSQTNSRRISRNIKKLSIPCPVISRGETIFSSEFCRAIVNQSESKLICASGSPSQNVSVGCEPHAETMKSVNNLTFTNENMTQAEISEVNLGCSKLSCCKMNTFRENLQGEKNLAFKFIDDDQEISNPVDIFQVYAKYLLSTINFMFSQTTLDSKVMKGGLLYLEKSLSKNLFHLLTTPHRCAMKDDSVTDYLKYIFAATELRKEDNMTSVTSDMGYEEENNIENVRKYDYCRSEETDCKKCSKMMSKVRALTLLMLRNSLRYTLEISYIMYCDKESKRSTVDKLTEMTQAFVNDIKVVISEDVPVQVDQEMVIIESAAAVVTHYVVMRAMEESGHQEEMQQIQYFVTNLIQESLADIKFELHINITVKRVCESATTAALDEAWFQYQDPVYVFAENVLKETVFKHIKKKVGFDALRESVRSVDPVYELLKTATLSWIRNGDELSASAEDLLIHSLIHKYVEDMEGFTMLFTTLSEYNCVEWEIRRICQENASKIVTHILWQIHKNYFEAGNSDLTINSTVLLELDIYLVQALDCYVEMIEQLSQALLKRLLLKLMSRSIVQQAVNQALAPVKLEQTAKSVSQSEEPSLESSNIQKLCEELKTLRTYLNFLIRDNKLRNEKQLMDHVKRITKQQQGFVSTNLQNMLDSCCVMENLPRDFTEEELFTVEWFVSGNLMKALPLSIKPFLVIFMLLLTLVSMLYFIVKGAEITTVQSQEWTCLALICCGLFGFLFEPLKVLLLMCFDHVCELHPDYK